MIVLDANVVSALMRPAEDVAAARWLDDQSPLSIWTTAITVLEVRFGLLRLPAGQRRAGLVARFDHVVERLIGKRVLPFDAEAAEHSARLLASLLSVGRPAQSNDAQIAGIALSRNATLATRNVRHFEGLGFAVVNPWTD
jgi:toxin FitB